MRSVPHPSQGVQGGVEPLLDLWGTSTYFGEDAGLASLYDLALLAGMYVMFAGFMHGAAMVAPAGVTAGEFAAMATPWLSAMTGSFRGFAEVIDHAARIVGALCGACAHPGERPPGEPFNSRPL